MTDMDTISDSVSEDRPSLKEEIPSVTTQATQEEETMSAKVETLVSPDSPCMKSTTAMKEEIARLRGALRMERVARKTLAEEHAVEVHTLRKTIVDLLAEENQDARYDADGLLVRASLSSWYADANKTQDDQYEVRSVTDFECTYDINLDDTTF
eukprot:GEMP01029941.1.p1 GENE.GEMP01029941.1~~GEMP01029941.1.p1  ORF type:complete len:154 (+),score=42.63 GEMP01029941.1:232-693(+)